MFTTTKISRGTQVGWQICIEDLSGFPFNWKNEHLSSEEKFKFNRTTIMKERKSHSRCMCINVFTLYIICFIVDTSARRKMNGAVSAFHGF